MLYCAQGGQQYYECLSYAYEISTVNRSSCKGEAVQATKLQYLSLWLRECVQRFSNEDFRHVIDRRQVPQQPEEGNMGPTTMCGYNRTITAPV